MMASTVEMRGVASSGELNSDTIDDFKESLGARNASIGKGVELGH